MLVGDVREADRAAGRCAGGQLQHGDAGVLGFGGEQHVPSSSGSDVSEFENQAHSSTCERGNLELGHYVKSLPPSWCSITCRPHSFFTLPGPAAGAVVLAGGDGARARPAADARVALVVQRVVRHVVLHDERPHVLLRPVAAAGSPSPG